MQFALAQSFAERLVTYYLEGLATPAGIGAVLAGLALTVSVLVADRMKWVVLTIAIYAGTYGLGRTESIGALMAPFSLIAAASQGVLLGLLLVLAVPAVRAPDRPRWWIPHAAPLCLFLFQITIASRQASAGIIERAGLAYLGSTLMLVVLGYGLPRWLTDAEQVRRLVRAVSWSVILLVLGSLFLLIVSRGQAMAGGRLYGTSNNPQRFGAILALSLPFSFALFQDRRNVGWSRAFHAAVPAFVIVMVIGSGSRMGGIMCLLGTALYFRTRLGAVALAGMVMAAIGLGLWLVLGSVLDEGQSRMFQTNNTRSEVWQDMVKEFWASPFIGSPAETARENSFLATASSAGLLGLAPLFLFVFVLLWQTFRTVRHRDLLGDYVPVADLVAASVVQFLVAWFFEGFLLGTLTEHMYVLYCTLALLGVVRERAARAVAEGRSFGEPPRDDAYPAYAAA